MALARLPITLMHRSLSMTQSKSNDAPESMSGQPDVNKGALRPSGHATTPEHVPDVDHPPRARSHDRPGFDQAVAQEEAQARSGTLPGSNDLRPAPDRDEEEK